MADNDNAAISAALLGIFILVAALFSGVSLLGSDASGAPNATVITKVNVTNTEPNIYDVSVLPSDITLTAGNVTTVNCTALVFDYNGWQDVNATNATFYDVSAGYAAADDNNNHYTNASCQACTSLTATNATCLCQFPVQYYANNNSWVCNVSVRDKGGWALESDRINLTDADNSTRIIINTLLAIDAPPEIDYGNLSVTQTSGQKNATLTNFGNVPFNVSVKGYGGDNETLGENWSMICASGNISVGFQKHSVTDGQAYASMTNLTSLFANISNFVLPQRTTDGGFAADRNTTYWRLQVPLGVGGYCNGTVVFAASAS